MAVADLSKVLWLRGKDLTGADGAGFATWVDQSGKGHDASSQNPATTKVAVGVTPSGGRAVSIAGASGFTLPPVSAARVITASSSFSSEPPGNAIDGLPNTFWTTNGTSSGWLRIQHPAAFAATGYTLRRRDDYPARNPKDWTFEGSSDGSAWTVLDSRTGVTWPTSGETKSFTFTNATPFTYYRLNVTANNGDTYLSVAELVITPNPSLAAELWVVVKGRPVAGSGAVGSFGSYASGSDGPLYPWANDGKVYENFGLASGNRQSFTPTLPLSEWRLYRVANDGTTWKAWLDSVEQAAATGRPVGWSTSTQYVGTNQDGVSLDGGYIAEMIVRDQVSTLAEVSDFITYFNTEHGLAVPGGAAIIPTTSGTGGSVVGSGATASTSTAITGIGGAAVGSVGSALVVGAPLVVDGMGGAQVGSVGAVEVPAPATRVGPWTGDLSRRTNLTLVASGAIDSMPALELPPAGFAERPLMRQSLTVPALTSLADAVGGQAVSAPDYAALEDAATVEEVGVPHVVIGGHDVTYFRGVPTQIGTFRSEEPFGDLSATVVFPQVTSMDDEPDDSNVHPFNWSRIRANVLIVLRRPDGTKTRLWSGHVVSRDIGDDGMTLTCQGSLWQASTDVHKVPTMLDPTDIGTLITKALNGVTSRRYPRLPAPRTGIMSRQRGSWSDSPLAYVQNLLATAWTASGRQWTVAKVPNTWRTYEMRLKKATPQWTVTNGARGVQADLNRDGVAVRNVIYGHGVGKDGYAWWNYHYPNLRQDDAPAYPYRSAGTVMSVGSTDAGTFSGEGVSAWQRRARDLGYNVTVNGVFNSDDAAAARAIQRRYGLRVDGVVGPQTWAGTFNVGGNGGDLSGAIRLPLAADPRTQKWLYNADGSIAGENPEYDKNHQIYADDVDFGEGRSREEGLESAQQIVDREKDPGWTGRITLRADPREGSRFLIAAGDKITLVGFRGADRVLHVTGAEYDLQGLTVTLDVDEKSRDAMTLAQIRDRNKEARKDPARRPGNVNRRSRLDVDSVVPFDGESGAGWVPKMALYPGLWSVVRIPVSELGRVARIDLTSSGPASKFAVALFGAPIQPSHLVKYVGNPLVSDDPFGPRAKTLEDRFGFIEGWGQKGQACGYGYGSEQDKSTLTGEFHDTGGFEYVSAKPPWVWVALYASSATFIRGRILPAPIQ